MLTHTQTNKMTREYLVILNEQIVSELIFNYGNFKKSMGNRCILIYLYLKIGALVLRNRVSKLLDWTKHIPKIWPLNCP